MHILLYSAIAKLLNDISVFLSLFFSCKGISCSGTVSFATSAALSILRKRPHNQIFTQMQKLCSPDFAVQTNFERDHITVYYFSLMSVIKFLLPLLQTLDQMGNHS